MIIQFLTVLLCLIFVGIIGLFCLKQFKINKSLKRCIAEWEKQKQYLIKMEKEIPLMKEPVSQLKDKLECSLDPEEDESNHLLNLFDSLKRQILPNDPVLAAIVAENVVRCNQKGISIRYRIAVPDTFTMQIEDTFFLYNILFDFAYFIASNSENDSSILRIRSDSQFDIWHLHMECSHSKKLDSIHLKDKEAIKELIRMNKNSGECSNDFLMLKYILKKYKLNINYEVKDELLELDIMS